MPTEPSEPRKKYLTLRQLFFRWHYRIGLLAVPLVLLLAITGLLLNHNAALKLHKIPVESAWLASWFGVSGSEAPEQITWDHLLLELHTGRFFGNWGPYVMDAAAIFLILLSFSGVYNWLRRVRRW